MNRKTRFPIAILSFLGLLLAGVSTAYAQEAPPRTTDDRGGSQTVTAPVDPAPQRGGDVTPVPGRGTATTQGSADVHPENRQRRAPEASRQTRPSGESDTQAGSSSSSSPSPIKDVQSAIKVQPRSQVNVRSKTPCGSPDCKSQVLSIKKQPTATTNAIKATSVKTTGSGFSGRARTGRR
jgi:hypothetical protein